MRWQYVVMTTIMCACLLSCFAISIKRSLPAHSPLSTVTEIDLATLVLSHSLIVLRLSCISASCRQYGK